MTRISHPSHFSSFSSVPMNRPAASQTYPTPAPRFSGHLSKPGLGLAAVLLSAVLGGIGCRPSQKAAEPHQSPIAEAPRPIASVRDAGTDAARALEIRRIGAHERCREGETRLVETLKSADLQSQDSLSHCSSQAIDLGDYIREVQRQGIVSSGNGDSDSFYQIQAPDSPESGAPMTVGEVDRTAFIAGNSPLKTFVLRQQQR